MNQFRSCFSGLAWQFVSYRMASGVWNESCYGLNIRLFDSFCAENYPAGVGLTQEMVDIWCAKRDTETNSSNNARTAVVRAFIDYLQKRGLTDVVPPAVLWPGPSTCIPYAFEDNELMRFFHVCDSIPAFPGKRAAIRKFTIPVFFRLLYSTGMRAIEARMLKKDNVDLVHGVIDIQESKGHSQHYVVMHDTMTDLMARYGQAIAMLQPYREYFFQSIKGSYYSNDWVSDNFRVLWDNANGPASPPVVYDFRHHYATTNINSWVDDGFGFCDRLQYLSKSMGHSSIEATRYYYSIVPRLADTLMDKTETGFNAIVPEVIDDAE